jgi:hypothetical protein
VWKDGKVERWKGGRVIGDKVSATRLSLPVRTDAVRTDWFTRKSYDARFPRERC